MIENEERAEERSYKKRIRLDAKRI